jgi:hypothetical protein
MLVSCLMVVHQRVIENVTLEAYEPECDRVQLAAAVAGLDSLNSLYDTATSVDQFLQLVFYSNGFVATYVPALHCSQKHLLMDPH